MQAIINSKLILPHTVLTGQTLLFGTHIYDILPAGSPLPEGTESIDAKGAYLSPGFINMHIHGCGGARYCSPSAPHQFQGLVLQVHDPYGILIFLVKSHISIHLVYEDLTRI